jgi:hypothetical protein
MCETNTEVSALSADEIKSVLENRILKHFHGNVEELESMRMNVGYPVLMLTMSALEFVSGIRFRKSRERKEPEPHHVDEYFAQYMRQIDDRYGKLYSTKMRRIPIQAAVLSLKQSGAPYTNVGTLLRESMRNRLAHSCGSILEIDAREETRHLHLEPRTISRFTNLYVHAYQLYDDYRSSLALLFDDIRKHTAINEVVHRNLCREWARVRLACKAVDEVLAESGKQVSDLPPYYEDTERCEILKLQDRSLKFIASY